MATQAEAEVAAPEEAAKPADQTGPQYWFYHLEGSTLESVLPSLLEKVLQKGWRALVKAPSAQINALDNYLWAYREDAFLPHGRDDEPQSDVQPIVLTDARNSAQGFEIVILIDGTDIEDVTTSQRVMVMINGRVQEDVARERARWRRLKKLGAELSYYQQTERGGWEKKL